MNLRRWQIHRFLKKRRLRKVNRVLRLVQDVRQDHRARPEKQ